MQYNHLETKLEKEQVNNLREEYNKLSKEGKSKNDIIKCLIDKHDDETPYVWILRAIP